MCPAGPYGTAIEPLNDCLSASRPPYYTWQGSGLRKAHFGSSSRGHEVRLQGWYRGEGTSFFHFDSSACLLLVAVYFLISCSSQGLSAIQLLHLAVWFLTETVVGSYSNTSCVVGRILSWPLNFHPLMYTHFLPVIQANTNLGTAVKGFCKNNYGPKLVALKTESLLLDLA